MTLTVTVSHDQDEGVWYVERSDVPGLNAEAGSLDELVAVIAELVPHLIAANLPDHGDDAGKYRVCVQHMVAA